MKYRNFNTNFWYDGYICDLTRDEKLLFVYLLFNSRVDKVGIYELPDRFIQNDLGFTQQELSLIKIKFEKDHKFYFYKGWIYVANFSEHNTFSTAPNVLITFKKEFDAVPIYIKQYFFKDLKLQYKIPIENTKSVTVSVIDMVIVIVMVNRVDTLDRVGRVEKIPIIHESMNEVVDPKDIPF